MSNWPYPRIVAHRGGGKLAPENTLAAIDVGAKYGHKMIEFDAKLSKDGEIFLLHDDNLERTSNGWGVAGELNWQDLLRVDAGSWYSKAFKGEPLPLLSQVAERCREHGMMANIVNVDRHAAPVVNNFQGLVGMKDNFHAFGVACQRFIDTVINNFLTKMVRTGGVSIHARTAAHRL